MQNKMKLLSGRLTIERENYDNDQLIAKMYDIVQWKINN